MHQGRSPGTGGVAARVRDEAGGGPSGGEAPEAKLAELLAHIERLEQLVLGGVATLDDYGALALAQQEWERNL